MRQNVGDGQDIGGWYSGEGVEGRRGVRHTVSYQPPRPNLSLGSRVNTFNNRGVQYAALSYYPAGAGGGLSEYLTKVSS